MWEYSYDIIYVAFPEYGFDGCIAEPFFFEFGQKYTRVGGAEAAPHGATHYLGVVSVVELENVVVES